MKKFEAHCTLGDLLNFLDLWGCDQKILVSHIGKNSKLEVYNTGFEGQIVNPVFFEVICASELSKKISNYNVSFNGELVDNCGRVVDDLKEYFIMRITSDNQNSIVRLSRVKSLPEEMLIDLDKNHKTFEQRRDQIRKVALWLLPSDSMTRSILMTIESSD
jgi:hypothetical protein